MNLNRTRNNLADLLAIVLMLTAGVLLIAGAVALVGRLFGASWGCDG